MKNCEFYLLQEWYLKQCDGDWEHEFGIETETLDNRLVTIDLQHTSLVNK